MNWGETVESFMCYGGRDSFANAAMIPNIFHMSGRCVLTIEKIEKRFKNP